MKARNQWLASKAAGVAKTALSVKAAGVAKTALSVKVAGVARAALSAVLALSLSLPVQGLAWAAEEPADQATTEQAQDVQTQGTTENAQQADGNNDAGKDVGQEGSDIQATHETLPLENYLKDKDAAEGDIAAAEKGSDEGFNSPSDKGEGKKSPVSDGLADESENDGAADSEGDDDAKLEDEPPEIVKADMTLAQSVPGTVLTYESMRFVTNADDPTTVTFNGWSGIASAQPSDALVIPQSFTLGAQTYTVTAISPTETAITRADSVLAENASEAATYIARAEAVAEEGAASAVTSISVPATVEVIDAAVFAAFPGARSIEVADDNPAYASLNGIVYTSDMSTLVAVPEGIVGKALLSGKLKAVNPAAFTRAFKLSGIDVEEADDAFFTSVYGILYSDDGVNLVAAPAGLGSTAILSPACKNIGEAAFWGNTDPAVYAASSTQVINGEASVAPLQLIKAFGQIDSILGSRIVDEKYELAGAFQQTTASVQIAVQGELSEDAAGALKASWLTAGFTSVEVSNQSEMPAQITEGSYTYTLLDDMTLAIAWADPMQQPRGGFVDIPAEFNYNGLNLAVAQVATGGFAGVRGLRLVNLPATVTEIGVAAFENCADLKTVEFPAGLRKIGARAFADTSLLSAVIPADVKTIGSQAFEGLVDTTICDLSKADVASDVLSLAHGVSVYVMPQAQGRWQAGVAAAGVHIYTAGAISTNAHATAKIEEAVSIKDAGIELAAEGDAAASWSYRAQRISLNTETLEITPMAVGRCEASVKVTVPISTMRKKATIVEGLATLGDGEDSSSSLLVEQDSEVVMGSAAGAVEGEVAETSDSEEGVEGGPTEEVAPDAEDSPSDDAAVDKGNDYQRDPNLGPDGEQGNIKEEVALDPATLSLERTADDGTVSIGELIFRPSGDNYVVLPKNQYITGDENGVLTIPETVNGRKVVGVYNNNATFSDCRLIKKIVIPRFFTSLAGGPFGNNDSLEAIEVSSQNTVLASYDGLLYKKTSATTVQLERFPDAKKDENGQVLTSFVIPQTITAFQGQVMTVTGIGMEALTCNKLNHLVLPTTITSIGAWNFSNMFDLEEISIPDAVTNMSWEGTIGIFDKLRDYPNLRRLSIGAGITSITDAYSPFGQNCPNLKDIYVNGNITSVGNNCFKGLPLTGETYEYEGKTYEQKDVTIHLPFVTDEEKEAVQRPWMERGFNKFDSQASKLKFYETETSGELKVAPLNKDIVGDVVIPDYYEGIGYSSDGKTQKQVKGNIVSFINHDTAFDNCHYITSLRIPRYFKLVSSGWGAVDSLTSLQYYTVSPYNKYYTTYEGHLYIACDESNQNYSDTKLSLLKIADGCGKDVISIPETITYKKYNENNETVEFSATVSSVHNCGALVIGTSSVKRIDFPSSITRISSWGYAGYGFEELTIPDSVTNINFLGFYGTYLSTLENSVEEQKNIYKKSGKEFRGIGLKKLTFGAGVTAIYGSSVDITEATTAYPLVLPSPYLKDIYVRGEITRITGSNTFYGIPDKKINGTVQTFTYTDGAGKEVTKNLKDCTIHLPGSKKNTQEERDAEVESWKQVWRAYGFNQFDTPDEILNYTWDSSTQGWNVSLKSKDYSGPVTIPAYHSTDDHKDVPVTTINSTDSWSGFRSITSVSLPSTLQKIVGGPFGQNDRLTDFNVDRSNPVFFSYNGALYKRVEDTSASQGGSSGKSYACYLERWPEGRGQSAIVPSTVTGPNPDPEKCNDRSQDVIYTVTGLSQEAFATSDVIESVVLPNTVKTITSWNFFSMSKLQSFTIGDSVEELNDAVGACYFNGGNLPLNNLNTLKLGAKITSINSGNAFSGGMPSLTDIYVSSRFVDNGLNANAFSEVPTTAINGKVKKKPTIHFTTAEAAAAQHVWEESGFVFFALDFQNDETQEGSDKYYTVAFDTKEGTPIQTQVLKSAFKDGDYETVKAADPGTGATTRDGFEFGGWYTNISCTGDPYNFDTPVTGNIILYAKWIGQTGVPYIVNYWVQQLDHEAYPLTMSGDDPNYVINKREAKTGMAGSVTDSEPIDIDGYEKPATLRELIDGSGTTQVNYFYMLKTYPYNLRYDARVDTTGSDSSGDYVFSRQINLKAKITDWYFYNLTKWSADDGNNGNTFEIPVIKPAGSADLTDSGEHTGSFTMQAHQVVAKPVIDAQEFSIAYDLNGGTSDAEYPDEYIYGAGAVSLANPTKDNYVFTGWTISGGKNGQGQDVSVALTQNPRENPGVNESPFVSTAIPNGTGGNLKLTANWKEKKYTIAFAPNTSVNSGNADDNKLVGKDYTSSIKLPALQAEGDVAAYAPKKDNYVLGGWYTNAAYKDGTKYACGAGVTVKGLLDAGCPVGENDVITLYAIWDCVNFTAKIHNPTPYAVTVQERRYYYSWNGASWDRTSSNTAIKKTIEPNGTLELEGATKWRTERYTTGLDGNFFRFPHALVIFGEFDKIGPRSTYDYGEYVMECPGVSFTGVGCTASVALSESEVKNSYGTLYCSDDQYSDKPDIYYMKSENDYEVTLDRQVPEGEVSTPASVEKLYEWYGKGFYADTEHEAKVPSITPPKRPGYTFTGYWRANGEDEPVQYIDANGAFTNEMTNTTFLADTTLTAGWDVNSYTISYDFADQTDPSYDPETKKGTATLGEGVTNATTYNVTSSDIKLNNPTRDGYDFAGWNITSDETGGTAKIEGNDGTNATIKTGTYGNLKATAKWTPKKVKIVFNETNGSWANNDNKPISSMEVSWNAQKDDENWAGWSVPGKKGSFNESVPSRTGYEFLGWSLDLSDAQGSMTSGAVDVVADATCMTSNFHSTYATHETVNLYPVWKAYDYKVKLDPNNGSFNNWSYTSQGGTTSNFYGSSSIEIPYRYADAADASAYRDKLVTFPKEASDISRHGYTLAGWVLSTDKRKTPDAYASVSSCGHASDVTYVAVWAPDTFEVTFDQGDTASPDNGKASRAVGFAASKFFPAEFETEETLKSKVKDAADGVGVVVTYTYHDGKKETNWEGEASYDAALQVVPTVADVFSRTAYSIAPGGWSGASSASGALEGSGSLMEALYSASKEPGGAKVTANWVKEKYTITFESDYLSPEPIEYTYEDQKTLPELKKDGWVFEGWTVEVLEGENGTTEKVVDDPANAKQKLVGEGNWGNLKATASWRPKTYKVTFEPNGAGAPASTVENQSSKPADWTVTFDAPANNGEVPSAGGTAYSALGYTLAGWSTDPNYDLDNPAATPGAKFYRAANDKNTVGDKLDQNLWLDSNGGGVDNSGENVSVPLYAVWREHKFTVRFSQDKADNYERGSNLVMADDTDCQYSDTIELPAGEPTKIGYSFEGWALDANGDGAADGSIAYKATDDRDDKPLTPKVLAKQMGDGEKEASAEGKTLHMAAKWTPISLTIVYDANPGGSDAAIADTWADIAEGSGDRYASFGTAVWDDSNKTVTQTVTFNDETKSLLPTVGTFQRTNYCPSDFWNTGSDGKGKKVKGGAGDAESPLRIAKSEPIPSDGTQNDSLNIPAGDNDAVTYNMLWRHFVMGAKEGFETPQKFYADWHPSVSIALPVNPVDLTFYIQTGKTDDVAMPIKANTDFRTKLWMKVDGAKSASGGLQTTAEWLFSPESLKSAPTFDEGFPATVDYVVGDSVRASVPLFGTWEVTESGTAIATKVDEGGSSADTVIDRSEYPSSSDQDNADVEGGPDAALLVKDDVGTKYRTILDGAVRLNFNPSTTPWQNSPGVWESRFAANQGGVEGSQGIEADSFFRIIWTVEIA